MGDLKDTPDSITLKVQVDLRHVSQGLHAAKDARLQAEALAAWIEGLAHQTHFPVGENTLQRLRDSGDRRPRFIMKSLKRPMDAPDHARPDLPTPNQYKAARRELAIVFQALGATPGEYQLAEAKAIIDPARHDYRALVHRDIRRLARMPVLLFAMEQFDALVVDYEYRVARLKMSLDHEVDFDREHDLAEAHEKFLSNIANYRYLVEAALALNSEGNDVPTTEDMTDLVAKIDWLMVLYQASDTLHNAIDAGGIRLSDTFVPEVFYASNEPEQYRREMAADMLGIGEASDAVSPLSEHELTELNEAMQHDAGFTLRHLLNALTMLYRWPSATGNPEDLHLSYRAPANIIAATLHQSFPEIDELTAHQVITFLTLDAGLIRVLAGRHEEEADVPVWEHRKRSHRYMIRPLVDLGDHQIAWGAAATYRAHNIWAGSLSDGYLPADLPWPHVNDVALRIKRRIEKELETRAHTICQRHTPYVLPGVNFQKRFPKEGFEDVGDYDVLAYWPDQNLWVTVECKYNKPPFCLKDARRLREYIFGNHPGEGHLGKIERRRTFLGERLNHLRELLGWPAPSNQAPTITDLYVGPRIFYWMRNPPYPTHVEFVRVGLLDAWLSAALVPADA